LPVVGVWPCRTSSTVVIEGGGNLLGRAMAILNLLSSSMKRDAQLKRLEEEIVGCAACPRLVEWRQAVARELPVHRDARRGPDVASEVFE
jgi:hypothetical protein